MLDKCIEQGAFELIEYNEGMASVILDNREDF